MFDEWSGLADLLANIIEKYVSDLDIEDMPNTAVKTNLKNKVEDKKEKYSIAYSTVIGYNKRDNVIIISILCS